MGASWSAFLPKKREKPHTPVFIMASNHTHRLNDKTTRLSNGSTAEPMWTQIYSPTSQIPSPTIDRSRSTSSPIISTSKNTLRGLSAEREISLFSIFNSSFEGFPYLINCAYMIIVNSTSSMQKSTLCRRAGIGLSEDAEPLRVTYSDNT